MESHCLFRVGFSSLIKSISKKFLINNNNNNNESFCIHGVLYHKKVLSLRAVLK